MKAECEQEHNEMKDERKKKKREANKFSHKAIHLTNGTEWMKKMRDEQWEKEKRGNNNKKRVVGI